MKYNNYELEIIDDKSCVIVKYDASCEDSTIEIPSSVDIDGKNYAITKIGFEAFKDACNLNTVIIPDSILEIDPRAFVNCYFLQEVVVPETVVEIHNCVFDGCFALNPGILLYNNKKTCYGWIGDKDECIEVVLPDTVTEIGEFAFEDCKNLKNVVIPNSVTLIKYGAFMGCSSLKKIVIPETTSIDDSAFDYGIKVCMGSDSEVCEEDTEEVDEGTHNVEILIKANSIPAYEICGVTLEKLQVSDEDEIDDVDENVIRDNLYNNLDSSDYYLDDIDSVEVSIDGDESFELEDLNFSNTSEDKSILEDRWLRSEKGFIIVNSKDGSGWELTYSFEIQGEFNPNKLTFRTVHYYNGDEKLYSETFVYYDDEEISLDNVDYDEYYDNFSIYKIEKEVTPITCVSSDTSSNGRDMSKYALNGEGSYNKSELGAAAVAFAVNKLTAEGKSVDEAVEQINGIMKKNKMILASSKEGFFDEKRCKTADANGTTIYVNTQWTVEKFDEFVEGMNNLLA